MIFSIQNNIKNNFQTYKNLKDVLIYGNEYSKIDFKNVNFVEGNLSVLILMSSFRLKDCFDKNLFLNLSPRIEDLFNRNKLNLYITGNCCKDTRNTTIDTWLYRHEKDNEENKEKLNEYVYSLFEHQRITNLINNVLKEQVTNSIFEVIANIFQHSKQNFMFIAGQFYPEQRKFNITIGNFGKTIIENVVGINPTFSSEEAMRWAFEYPNTTKEKNVMMGGIGIAFLKRFLSDNHGKLTIVSGEIFYQQNDDQEKFKNIGYNFPGTIVTLEINLNKQLILKKDYRQLIMEGL